MTADAHEVWRGGVNAWECDEMGHFNTRFYVARAVDGLAPLLAQLGLPGLFGPASATTLRVRQMHIRFLREARAATPLRLVGHVLSHGEHQAELLLMMHEVGNGELKATFRVEVDHVDSGDPDRRVPWPAIFRDRAVQRTIVLPPEAEPRGTGFGPVATRATLARADELGLTRIGMGVIGPDRADAFGRMVPHAFIAAVSDGIRGLTAPLREIVVRHSDDPPGHFGGAVLEFRIVHQRWPRLGDCYDIRSGLQKAEGSVQSIIHWMLDPVSGEVYGTMQSIAIVFDIDRRKAVRVCEAARAELNRLAIAGLEL